MPSANPSFWSTSRSFPWTVGRNFLAAWLFAICLFLNGLLAVPYGQAQLLLGGASELQLWSGQWWRLLTAGFHHADLLHLLFNSLVLWHMGQILEARWGTWRLFVFDVFALLVVSLIQAYTAPGNGLSGMAYAEFGVLAAWRTVDSGIAERFSRMSVWIGYFWLIVCIPITAAGLLPIANWAHVAGWCYGTLTALVLYGSVRQRAWWPLFITSHGFLVPMTYFALHPVWNGHYFWHLGDHEPNRAVRMQHYVRATELSPDEEGPWLNLALLNAEAGNLLAAWERILVFLQDHPGSSKGRKLAYSLAEQLAGQDLGPQAFLDMQQVLSQGPLYDDLHAILTRPTLPDWPENLQKLPLWPATPESAPTGIRPFSLSIEALDEQPVHPRQQPALPPEALP